MELLSILALTLLIQLPTDNLSATRVAPGSIVVDGADDDWTTEAFGGFVQFAPHENEAPTEVTFARAAYDEDAFYLFVEARDSSPDDIRGQLTRRDASSPSDWIHVFLDTYDDDRTAYRFSVNPADVQQDARLFDDNEDVNYNAVWEAKTRTSSKGWVAEFRIPFSQLRYDASHARWGIQVGRELARKQETSYLSAVPRGSNRVVAHFASLELESGPPSSRNIVVSPYVSGGVLRDGTGTSLDGTVGGGLDWAIGSALSLSLTVNPDFGQIESDPSVLNLSAFEVYLPEQRPFFMEGRELLHFPLGFGDGDVGSQSLFYSRRIGRAPNVSLDDGEVLLDAPTQTNIWGAAKLTGKKNGWSIAALDALVGSADATVETSDGQRRRRVEPMTNAAILRLSKDFRGGKTTVGLMGTHLVRDLDAHLEDRVVGQAFTGGADLAHRFSNLQLIGRVYGSHITGSATALESVQRSSTHLFQREDADHVQLDPSRTSMSGYGVSTMFGKLSGKHWRAAAGAIVQSPGFDPNDLGFLPRADSQTAFLWAQLREDDPGAMHRVYGANFNLWGQKTFGNEITGVGGNSNVFWLLPGGSEVWAGGGRNLAALSVTGLRGGPAFKRPGRWFGWAGGRTDPRASLSASLDTSANLSDEGAGYSFDAEAEMSYRPTSAIEVSVSPSIERRTDDLQFVDAVAEGAVVGHLEQTTAQLAVRASWTFSPALSLQIYAAPFVSSGTYADFRTTAQPRANRYNDRFRAIDYEGGEAFTFVELRSNVVLRWEYTLGSTLFFVWSRGMSDSAEVTGGFDDDLARLVDAPSDDRVMVKLTYWLPI